MADVGVFRRYKGFGDFQEEARARGLQEALAQVKIAQSQQQMQRDLTGQNLPAALQLANEYESAIASGNLDRANNIAVFAKTLDKGVIQGPDGGYMAMQGYGPALGEIAAAKAGAAQQAEKNVDLQMNPLIKGSEADAVNASKLEYTPLIDTAKTDAAGAINDATVDPLIKQLTEYNSKSFEMPYSESALGITRIIPSKGIQDKVTNTDLLRQARLDMAAPLAKQLGVNPTDKDFQASLNRIFNLNTSQASRQAQIDALGKRIEERRAARATRMNAADIFGGEVPQGNFRETLGNAAQPPAMKPADIERSLFNARKAIKANPSARGQILQKLKDAGISIKGL